MCFDGALGDIQVASDFGVVTSLEKQVDDLAFPGSHSIELFFHKFSAPHRYARPREVALNRCPLGVWIRVFPSHFATTWPKSVRQVN